MDTQATAATLEAGDRLLITNGSTTVATLQLAGDYDGDTFATLADGAGGTAITVTPGQRLTTPSPGLFSQQTAGLRSGAGVSVAGLWGDASRRTHHDRHPRPPRAGLTRIAPADFDQGSPAVPISSRVG